MVRACPLCPVCQPSQPPVESRIMLNTVEVIGRVGGGGFGNGSSMPKRNTFFVFLVIQYSTIHYSTVQYTRVFPLVSICLIHPSVGRTGAAMCWTAMCKDQGCKQRCPLLLAHLVRYCEHGTCSVSKLVECLLVLALARKERHLLLLSGALPQSWMLV